MARLYEVVDRSPRTSASRAILGDGETSRVRAGPPARDVRRDGPHQGAPGRVPSQRSGRYTPPIPRRQQGEPQVDGAAHPGLLLILGALMIVLNYFNVLPAGPSNWYLVGGIVLIAVGFVVATQYH